MTGRRDVKGKCRGTILEEVWCLLDEHSPEKSHSQREKEKERERCGGAGQSLMPQFQESSSGCQEDSTLTFTSSPLLSLLVFHPLVGIKNTPVLELKTMKSCDRNKHKVHAQ